MIVKFEDAQFNRIFPFYILINANLTIESYGATLEKIFPATGKKPFLDNYKIQRPELSVYDFNSLKSLINQLIIIECKNPQKTILRGQIELLPETNQLLFIGSAWFNSMEQVITNKLSLNDFALHDPMIDLLHVVKTQEITMDDLKYLLEKVNNQKNELKNAAREIQDIALFPMQNPDPLTRIDSSGNILSENPVAETLTELNYKGNRYSKAEFWKIIAGILDPNTEREVVEADFKDKTYSFVIKSIPQLGYFNIYGRDITIQKKNEEQIKLLALVASANENGVLFTDSKSRIIYANEGYLKLTGYEFQDISGRSSVTVGKSAYTDRQAIREMREAFFSGKSFNIEIIHTRKDGSWFWCRCKGQPTVNENGKVLNYFAIIEDITLEKERETQLKILSSIAAENTNGVIISNKEGKIEWVNKSFEEMTGYSLEEIKNTKPGNLLQGKNTNPETIAYLRKQINAGEPFVCEILNYHRNGIPYWSRLQGQALKDRNGNIEKYFAIKENISKEKETQQKLNEFENRLRSALEMIGDNFWEYDFRTDKTYFSNPNNIFIGNVSTSETDYNKIWWSKIHKNDLHQLEENDRKCRNGETDYHILEYRMVQNDGSVKWVLDRGVVIEKDNEGKPIKLVGTHTDITQQKNAQEAVRRKEEKYRNIIANINLGLLEVDNEEKIQYANQRFCEMSGYELEELIGKKASEMFARNESRELIESKNELRKKNISDVYEVFVSTKNNEYKWWMISGAPNYNDKGELVGSIGIHLDITDQKKLELELIEAKNIAEASKIAKEIFLANMSHEIRTPMNAIIGMSNQFAKTNLENNQKLYLKTIQSAANNLLIIINDILDLSKIEAGKLSIENLGFEPGKILDEVMQVMMYKAEEKGISFTNSFYDNKLAKVLIGDPYRLNQILLNLVSNSIKFTEKGSVDIMCEVIEDKTDAQKIKMTVKDTGIGMEESFVKQIFDKFTQEYRKGNRKFGGTGLGMSISKELVELMGGEINVESKKGIGTSISFSLELKKGNLSDLEETDATEITNDFLNGKRILVADDNDHNRLVASIILQNYGAEIIEAANGHEALVAAKNNRTDLILMDIQMPVLDGYEATRILREQGEKIPVIAVTANAIKGENEKCIQAGMNDYISKPFKEEDFLKTIAKWLTPDFENKANIKEELDFIPEPDEALIDLAPETETNYDFLKGKKIVIADDSSYNRMIVSIILKNYGAVTFDVVNGQEALTAAESNKADLILMDIQMPVLNGYEATKIIREHGNKIPVIALTASTNNGESEMCIEAGMNDYIPKPINKEVFLATITKWLSADFSIKENEMEEHVISPKFNEPLYNLSSLEAISRGNEAFVRKMINLFCEQIPPMIVEMISAYNVSDLEKMGAVAHKIKPTLDNLNINSLKQHIRTIENAGKEKKPLPELKQLLKKTETTITQVVKEMRQEFPG